MARQPARRPGALVTVSGLTHTYDTGQERVVALRRVDLDVAPGERLAVMGRSGSGKTTLLNILAGLEVPTAGQAVIAGHDLSAIGRRERDAYRREAVGYVWQRPETGLLPALTVLENVLAPALGGRANGHGHVGHAVRLLEALRLGSRMDDRPDQLTPVEAQRLAVAVALANGPPLLLADELTARLEWFAARDLLMDLEGLLDELGAAAIIVTHDPRLERYVHRVVSIRDGVATAVGSTQRVIAGRSRMR